MPNVLYVSSTDERLGTEKEWTLTIDLRKFLSENLSRFSRSGCARHAKVFGEFFCRALTVCLRIYIQHSVRSLDKV